MKTYHSAVNAQRKLLWKSNWPPTQAQWTFGGLTGAFAAYKGGPAIARWKAERNFRKAKAAQKTKPSKAGGEPTKPTQEFPNTEVSQNPLSGNTMGADDAIIENTATTDIAATASADAGAAAAADVAVGEAAEVGLAEGALGLGGGLATGGLGLAAGIAITMLLPSLLGGGNDANKALAAALQSIETAIGNLANEVHIQRSINAQQQAFDNTVQNHFRDQNLLNQKLEAEVNDNAQAIFALEGEMQRMGDSLQVNRGLISE